MGNSNFLKVKSKEYKERQRKFQVLSIKNAVKRNELTLGQANDILLASVKADNMDLLKKLKGGDQRKQFEKNLKDLQIQMSSKKRRQVRLEDMVQRHRRNQSAIEQYIESEKDAIMTSNFADPIAYYDAHLSRMIPSSDQKSVKQRVQTQFQTTEAEVGEPWNTSNIDDRAIMMFEGPGKVEPPLAQKNSSSNSKLLQKSSSRKKKLSTSPEVYDPNPNMGTVYGSYQRPRTAMRFRTNQSITVAQNKTNDVQYGYRNLKSHIREQNKF